MSNISPQTVKKIAHLARLGISEQEVQEYSSQLSSILELVEQMNAADTSNVDSHLLNNSQPLRKDAVTEPNQREALQAIAPLNADGTKTTEAGLYLVPQVIE